MYTITVDDKDLYIPDSEDYQVSSAIISINTDSVAYLDMDIPCTNKGLKEIKQQASVVRVYDNGVLRYKMFVDNIDYDFDNTAKVSCTSVLAYLKDSLVRPYSTVDSEEGITAPSSIDGYFSWLIEQHNKNIRDTKKYFYVGVNQGALMDRNNYIYRASTEVPTTSDEIKNKILDTYGAYISLTFNGDLNVINLYADVHDSNEQVIDFGVNLLDLTKSVNTESSYTAVRPTGAVPKTENNSTSLPITISSIPDGVSKWNSDVYKKGDVVYSISGVREYGYKECEYSNTDITDVENLYRASVVYLNKLVNPYLTIDVKAVDLSLLYMDKYSPMEVGQAVRVRSEPHGVDEYLRISEISIDLLDPSNDSYTLGESYDSLTGQQSSYMKKLNSSINASFDIVGSAADAASKLADAAKKTANEADKKAQDATSKANDANTKADQASQNAQKANEAAKKAQEDATAAIGSAKDAADKAASASQKADDNTAKITTVENTIKTISGDTATAIANAKAAQAAADAAKKAADQAQSDASTANTEIGKVQSQVGTINTEIGNIKQEATDLRDDLSGQITTVKNTMEADYTRKTELSDTTATLRNEISESAAGVIHTVSQDYATKKELKTTTDATNKNAADLTNAINKFNSDVDNLQGQIDGAIETWFYDVDPTDKNEPAVNWNTDTLKKAHLGDLYYNTVSGYCWRYQLQNGSYSWSRITDVDVTKALADAAAAQTTANSKKRIFVATPNPPYDVGDLWTQGSTGDIMRCQTAKTSSQSYAAADWVKASKYTDDTAVTKLSNTVEKTYSTKTEVKQLSDQVSSTVSSLETVRISAEAAQTSADNAKKAADAAQTAADAAKTNAATAQSKADEAAKNLAKAEENLKTLQSQANATDEQLTAAKAEVEKAKTAAATAQSTADTAKANAKTAQDTANTAKANAKTAQDDVNALKNRVTAAETSIKQNSDAIALRATKTEVTSAIDGISVGGRNYVLGSEKLSNFKIENPNRVTWINQVYTRIGDLNGSNYGIYYDCAIPITIGSSTRLSVHLTDVSGPFHVGLCNVNQFTFPWNDAVVEVDSNGLAVVKTTWSTEHDKIRIYIASTQVGATCKLSKIKLETGNKATDWSPAPEDLVAESKTYTDAQIKVSADGIKSEVSSVKSTADSALKKATSVEQTANNIKSTVSSISTENNGRNLITIGPSNLVPNEWYMQYTRLRVYGTDQGGVPCVSCTPGDTYLMFCGDTKLNLTKDDKIVFKGIVPNWSTSNVDAILAVWFYTETHEYTSGINGSVLHLKAGLWNACEGEILISKIPSDARYYIVGLQFTSGSKIGLTTSSYCEIARSYTLTKVEQTATDLTTKITTAQNTANTANSTANAAQTAANTLETLIRQSGDGVEVAKKVNGEYTSTKTLMSDDGVHIQDQTGADLASFTANNCQIGSSSKNNLNIDTDGVDIRDGSTVLASFTKDDIKLAKGSLSIGYNDGAYIYPNYNVLHLCSSKRFGEAGWTSSNRISIGYENINICAEGGAYSEEGFDPGIYLSIRDTSSGVDKLKSGQLRDWVVAEGASTNWYYRKWASGYAECWGLFPYVYNEFKWWTSSSYVKYTYPEFSSIPYPFSFSERPKLYVAYTPYEAQSGLAIISYNDSKATTETGVINVMIPDYGATGNGSGRMNIYACGKY